MALDLADPEEFSYIQSACLPLCQDAEDIERLMRDCLDGSFIRVAHNGSLERLIVNTDYLPDHMSMVERQRRRSQECGGWGAAAREKSANRGGRRVRSFTPDEMRKIRAMLLGGLSNQQICIELRTKNEKIRPIRAAMLAAGEITPRSAKRA